MLDVRNFIDGRWQEVGNGRTLKKYGPRDGRLLCEFGAGEARDVDAAVTSARHAHEDGRWSQKSVQERKDTLHQLAALLEKHSEELALLECLDVGKPISDALTVDVATAAAIIRYNAEAADKLNSKVYAADGANLSYQLRRPIGVVAGIVGWNFPLALAAGKVGPALVMGNSLILKPSELTSFSTARLAELAVEAGVPPGVLNVVHGDAAIGAALAQHSGVDLVSFTGSTLTGKKLLIASGQSNMKRMLLECGGKAPNIVFEDGPDLDAVATAVVGRAFWNQGQVCTASSRLLVQASIKDELLRRIIEKASTWVSGDPLDPATKLGALVSREHQRKVLDYIRNGEREGARKAYQSNAAAPHEAGFYVEPVIFAEVSPRHTIAQEEIFGPVLSVMPFRDEAEAIRIANSTIYGLSAVLWTKDVGRAFRVTAGIDAGWVIVNATERPSAGPGEGVLSLGGHKQSGMGLEGGLEGLEAYTSQTAVQVFF